MTSCEDVIELDLETSEPQTIIEATIDATTQTATVLLTKSNGFYDQDAPTNLVSTKWKISISQQQQTFR